MLFTFLVVFILGLGLVSANTYAAEPTHWGREYLVSQMIGAKIVNSQGEELGIIRNVAIDSNGRIDSVILRVGGKSVAVPFAAMRFDRVRKDLVLNVNRQVLESLPAFKMPDLTEEKQAEDIYKYFGLEPYWTATSHNPYRWGGTAQDF